MLDPSGTGGYISIRVRYPPGVPAERGSKKTAPANRSSRGCCVWATVSVTMTKTLQQLQVSLVLVWRRTPGRPFCIAPPKIIHRTDVRQGKNGSPTKTGRGVNRPGPSFCTNSSRLLDCRRAGGVISYSLIASQGDCDVPTDEGRK